jgi:predicted amidohydrolase
MVTVAAAQPLVIPGDVAGNVERMLALVHESARRGARLVLFSECSINGYDLQGVGARAAIDLQHGAFDALQDAARRTGQLVVAGFYERGSDGRIYNSAAALFPDGRRVVQRKFLVTQPEMAHGVCAGPRQRTILEHQGLRLAILICADGGIEGIHAELSASGVDVVLAPTAGLGSDSHAFHQRELSDPQRLEQYVKAAQSVCFIDPRTCLRFDMGMVACNQMGYSQAHSYFHCGHSSVVDRTGELSALAPGRFVVEHLKPDLAVGKVTPRRPAP